MALAVAVWLQFAPVAGNPIEFILLANLFGYLALPPMYLPGDIRLSDAWRDHPQMVVGQIAGMFGIVMIVVLVLLVKHTQVPPV